MGRVSELFYKFDVPNVVAGLIIPGHPVVDWKNRPDNR